jgi:uncharacterized cupredoxin-like copper-binding protein
MRKVVAVVAALVVGTLTTAVAASARDGSVRNTDVLGPGLVTVDVDIDHSRFSFETLRVREGTVVRFVVANDDPIDHELIVGDDAVHARHEDGGESFHPPVPGEVSVAPGETGLTYYEFGDPGSYLVACHLPGHLAFGMQAVVEVIPR